MGGDLGGIARGLAPTTRAGGKPQRRRHRQPVAPVGRKRGCAKGEADAVGYDASKKVKGRKVHALVDTEGLPLRVVVHSAGIQDRDGAALVLIASASVASTGSNWSGPTAATTLAKSNSLSPSSRRCASRLSNAPTTVQDLSSCRAAGSSNGPFPGSAAIAASPRTTRTSPTRSRPSSRSPASSTPSGGSRACRLLSQALSLRACSRPCSAIELAHKLLRPVFGDQPPDIVQQLRNNQVARGRDFMR